MQPAHMHRQSPSWTHREDQRSTPPSSPHPIPETHPGDGWGPVHATIAFGDLDRWTRRYRSRSSNRYRWILRGPPRGQALEQSKPLVEARPPHLREDGDTCLRCSSPRSTCRVPDRSTGSSSRHAWFPSGKTGPGRSRRTFAKPLVDSTNVLRAVEEDAKVDETFESRLQNRRMR